MRAEPCVLSGPQSVHAIGARDDSGKAEISMILQRVVGVELIYSALFFGPGRE